MEARTPPLFVDTHVDIPWPQPEDQSSPSRYQFDLPKMRAGGVSAAVLIAYTPQQAVSEQSLAAANARAWGMVARIRSLTQAEGAALALCADDIEENYRNDCKSILIGLENAFSLRADLAEARRFYAAGVRYVGITHNGDNQFAGAAIPVRSHGDDPDVRPGLTPLGARLIAELNALGVIVDISHSSKQTALDILALSDAPVLASHSACRALVDHPRNLDDETLLRLRHVGGLVHIPAVDRFLRHNPAKAAAEAAHDAKFLSERNLTETALDDAQWELFWQGMRALDEEFGCACVRDLVDHIDYAVGLIGVEHVGVSSDFDGGGGIDGWRNCAESQSVVEELRARNYADGEIGKILGGNFLRLMRGVEAKRNVGNAAG